MKKITLVMLILSCLAIRAISQVTVTNFSTTTSTILPCHSADFTVTLINSGTAISNYCLTVDLDNNVSFINASGNVTASPTGNGEKFCFNLPGSSQPFTFTYSIHIACGIIPASSSNTLTITENVSGPGLPPSTHSYNIEFPVLVYNTANNLVYSGLYIPTGTLSTYTRSLTYQNNGTSLGVFDGQIYFEDDYSGCTAVLNGVTQPQITIDYVTLRITQFNGSSSVITPIANSSGVSNVFSFTYDLNVAGYSVDHFGTIEIEEHVTIVGCTFPSCQSNTNFQWGCTSDLCCAGLICDTKNFVLNRSGTPALEIYRTLPNIDGRPWDISCSGESLDWQFKVVNPLSATAPAFNVTLSLEMPAWVPANQIFTYIFQNSVTYTTSGIPGGNSAVHQTNQYLIDHFTTNVLPPTNCLDNSSPANKPLYKVNILIDVIPPGGEFTFNFSTYRCCADDDDGTYSLFNIDKYYNYWMMFPGASDECGAYTPVTMSNNGGLAHYPFPAMTNYAISSFAGPPSLTMTQDYDPDLADMYVPHGTPPICGTHDIFHVNNKTFLGPWGEADLISATPTSVPKGIFKVRWELSQGLKIDPADYSSLTMTKGTYTWPCITSGAYGISSGSWSTTGTFVEAYFDINDIIMQLPTHTFVDLRYFVEGSQINFMLTPCCPADEPATFTVKTSLFPNATNVCPQCFIPMSSVSGQIRVHCPGCITPGIIVNGFTLHRETMGYEDINNDGIEDTHPPVLIANSLGYPLNQLKLNHSIVGDILVGDLSSYFFDGDVTGITYSSGGLGFTLDYLYLEQKIPFSENTSSNLQMLNATFTVLDWVHLGVPTTFTVNVPIGFITKIGDVFFYKLSQSDLILWGAPAAFTFKENQHYHLVARMKVCNNFEPSDPNNPSAAECNHRGEIQNLMYFTGVPLASPTLGTGVPAFTGPPYLNTMIYYCEPFGGYHTFHSVENLNFERWSDIVSGSICTKSIQAMEQVRIGGGLDPNLFPYEYRPVPGYLQNFNFTIPAGFTLSAPTCTTTTSIKFHDPIFPFNTSPKSYISPYTGALSTTGPVSFNFNNYFSEVDIISPTGWANNISPPLPSGDEFFQCVITGQMVPLCDNTAPPFTIDYGQFVNYATYPTYGCAPSTEHIPNQAVAGALPEFTLPTNQLIVNFNGVTHVDASTEEICYTFQLSSDEGTIPYAFLYFGNIPQFTINTVTCTGGCSVPLLDGNGFWELGDITTAVCTYTICGHFICGTTQVINMPIPFTIGWNCSGYPASISSNTCYQMEYDDFTLTEMNAGLTTFSVTHPPGYYLCDPLPLQACVESSYNGSVYDLHFQLTLPPNLTLNTNTVVMHFGTFNFPIYTSSVSSPYDFDLSSYNSTFIDGLANGETVCIDYEVTPHCDYDGTMPSLLFSGMSYCGKPVSTNYNYPGTIPLIEDHCHPACDSSATDCKIDADFTWIGGRSRCSIIFQSHINTPGITVTGYHWDFGDAVGISSLANPIYTYAHSGIYHVCLTINYITSAGIRCDTTFCHWILVTGCRDEGCLVHADFTYDIYGCWVLFHDQSLHNGNIISWSWNFGDPGSGGNNYSTTQNPIHLFTAPGTYTVCLKVTVVYQEQVCTDEICMDVTVDRCTDCETQCDFQFNVQKCSVNFSGISAPPAPITAWYWDFGDGYHSNQQNPAHTYNHAGSYNVCLTVIAYYSDYTCVCQVCKNVIISEDCRPDECRLQALFNYSVAGCTVTFTDASIGFNNTSVYDWLWDFGDGSTSSHTDLVSHTYSAGGSYTVSLIAYGTNGQKICTDHIAIKVLISSDCKPFREFKDNDNTLGNVEYSIIPNPNKGNFKLSVFSNYETDVDVQINDVMNRNIAYRKIKVNKGENNYEYNLDNFSKGVYLIHLKNETNLKTLKLIIQ